MMIKKLAAAVAVAGTLAAPAASMAAGSGSAPKAHAAAASVERILARQDCREKRFEDPAEFRFDHGTGKGAMQRCINAKIRKAHFECSQEAREDPFEFREDYGVGAAAQQRCVRDELG